MLRLCSRKLLDATHLRTLSSIPMQSANIRLSISNNAITPRKFSAVTTAESSTLTTDQYTCSDPDKVRDPNSYWIEVEDWGMDWFDGRDVLHVRVKPSSNNAEWRGIGLYSQEGYWLSSLRWNERLRGEEPAIWLHWVGKDPVELSNTLPPPDSDGYYKFRISFTKRELVLHCNGELMGTRKNMLYQYRNVKRVWFQDLEVVEGYYMIEGDHSDDTGFKVYRDVPMFQRAKEMWKKIRDVQKEHVHEQFPDHGWRSS